jgi:flagella basal body P-ring formation protein FlgA
MKTNFIFGNNILVKRLILLLLSLLIQTSSVLAEEASTTTFNPYWISVKAKLEKHLSETLDPKLYKYEIVGPTRELKTFLGNRPDVQIVFEKLNLNTLASRKSVTATVYSADKKILDSLIINLDVKIYHKVFKLKHGIAQGQEIAAANLYEESILIEPLDTRLYAAGNLNQKVASIAIAADTPIKINMLRSQKLMQANQPIRVSSGTSIIQLELICKTVGSGDVGDVITVYCQDSQKKNLRAKIIEAGRGQLI